MANITRYVSDRYDYRAGASPQMLISELDLNVAYVGRMLDTIFDLVVHPKREIEGESIAAAIVSLLAYLQQIGGLIDALDNVIYGRTVSEDEKRPEDAPNAFGGHHAAGSA